MEYAFVIAMVNALGIGLGIICFGQLILMVREITINSKREDDGENYTMAHIYGTIVVCAGFLYGAGNFLFLLFTWLNRKL